MPVIASEYTGGGEVSSRGVITWTHWNGVYTITQATTTPTLATTWQIWNQACSSTNSITMPSATYTTTPSGVVITTWQSWGQSYTSGHLPAQRTQSLTDEQKARIAADRVRAAEQEAIRSAERQRVKLRAKRLLLDHLSPGQRQEYEANNFFTVVSYESQRRYRIRQGQAGNIDELDANGKPVRRLCVHPGERLPDEDAMLCQMLMLQHREEDTRQTANISLV